MVTIYDWFGYELSAKKRYALIREAGFDGVMLWWSEESGRGDYRTGPEEARSEGLFVENIHAPFQRQNDLWRDNLDGAALTDCYLQCITDCYELEIPTMVVHLPSENYPCTPLGLDRVKSMAEMAELLGVNVALENLWNYTNISYVLSRVDSPCLGFCYDSCHHNNYNPEADLLGTYGSRLMALHLHDNGGSQNQHQLPFDGHINWQETMRKIGEINYTGATALQPSGWDYMSYLPEVFLRKAYERAMALEELRYSTYRQMIRMVGMA